MAAATALKPQPQRPRVSETATPIMAKWDARVAPPGAGGIESPQSNYEFFIDSIKFHHDHHYVFGGGSGGQGGDRKGREEGGADYRAVVGLYDGVIGAGVGT